MLDQIPEHDKDLREKYARLLANIAQQEGPVSLDDLIRQAGYDPEETDVEAIKALLQEMAESKEKGDEIFFTLEMPGGEGSTLKL